ncbi:MAG: hypothetical protein GXY53_09125 [Desulfobulbus sp.]|nr:hypothetical protein [Desulfobulbus sp.]
MIRAVVISRPPQKRIAADHRAVIVRFSHASFLADGWLTGWNGAINDRPRTPFLLNNEDVLSANKTPGATWQQVQLHSKKRCPGRAGQKKLPSSPDRMPGKQPAHDTALQKQQTVEHKVLCIHGCAGYAGCSS